MKTISIVLAEDHHVVRQGLRALLAAEADLEVWARRRAASTCATSWSA